MCSKHSQLAETKVIWHRHITAITAALHVSFNVTTFLESWLWTECRSDHQSNSDTRPAPNYPRWVPRKKAQSLDKWTFFIGINTNSFTPTEASRHLIPEAYSLAIFLAFTSLCSPLLTATHYIYSHPFSIFITLLLTLSSESIWQVPYRCHPHFLNYHVVSKYIFLRKYQEHHCSIKRFMSFSFTLEHVAHTLVVERNLTVTYIHIYIYIY